MEIIVYLIVPTIFLGLIVIWALFWSIKNNQYEDLPGEAQRILHNDDDIKDNANRNDGDITSYS